MAPKYRLNYFDTKGAGEPIRFLLSYNNIDFEDNRVNRDEWASKIKPTTPFGKLPTLEVDDKVLHQSIAICRYLAKQSNLVGKNDWEAAEIDAIVDTVASDVKALMHNANQGDDKAEKLANLVKKDLPFYLEKFDNTIKNNGGYFVGGQLSWADIYVVGIMEPIGKMLGTEDLVASYPNLKALKDKVLNIPQIKKWIATRPPDCH